ncbi:hypothetical protein Scep_002785 [Stephania cephalantha]|uniref:Uncharacterized protein n=1 Tax=Stephania cephalantha TaxID=152367 RepID=A0AAP0LEK9_9MAGN
MDVTWGCQSSPSHKRSIDDDYQTSVENMEWAGRAMNAVLKTSNNNAIINTFLVASTVALGVRSVNQQRHIDSLQAEKQSLIKTNKSIKKTMWEWKQQLFADASDSPSSPSSPVSLARLKSIYGEAQPPIAPPKQQEATESVYSYVLSVGSGRMLEEGKLLVLEKLSPLGPYYCRTRMLKRITTRNSGRENP